MYFLAEYMMKGRMQAVLIATTFALLSLLFPPITVLSCCAVALVTLRKGVLEGLIVLLIAAMVGAVFSIFLVDNFLFVFGYGLLIWLPVWFISVVLFVSHNLARAIETAVLLGVVSVIGFYVLMPDPVLFWEAMLKNLIEPMLSETNNQDISIEQLTLSVEQFSHYMTGMVAAGYISGVLLSVILARWCQAMLYYREGFKQEFLALKTNRRIATTLIVMISCGLFAEGTVAEIAWNMIIPLFVLYTFIGMAIFHVLLTAKSNSRTMVSLFYGFMFMFSFITPLVFLPVAITGLSDSWLNMREKILNQANG